MTRMLQLSFSLTDEMADKVSVETTHDHVSAAEVVRRALRKYYDLK